MKDLYTFALITGASRGLGKEIALELAKRNYNLLLVSLKNEDLGKICNELNSKFDVEAFKFEGDLTKPNTVYNIARWAENFKVSVLINNAGIGGTTTFEGASPEYIDNIIQINIRATTLLTRLMLPRLMTCEKSYILNVGSLASFSPIPYKTIYPASKAYINYFSRSLAAELKETNVSVSVIHPGPMKTNPEVISRIEKQGLIGQLNLMDTKRMAEIAITKMFNKDKFIIPGIINKISRILLKIIPFKLRTRVLTVVYKRELVQKNEAMAG